MMEMTIWPASNPTASAAAAAMPTAPSTRHGDSITKGFRNRMLCRMVAGRFLCVRRDSPGVLRVGYAPAGVFQHRLNDLRRPLARHRLQHH